MIGILPVHKPIGMSSHDVVYAVRRVINPQGTPKSERMKVGHAGTLDPFASGVLLVTIGKATKLERYLHDHLKTYEAVIQLGQSTTTDDPEGDMLEESAVPPLPDSLEQHLQKEFVGMIQQRPPIFSALKQGGEALYKKARRGETIDVPTREVRIDSLQVLDVTESTIRIRTTVGSGTYIRALGRDIGEFLGTKAHLTELVRTSIGPWSLDACVNIEELTAETIVQHSGFSGAHLGLSEIEISHDAQKEIQFGRPIPPPDYSIETDQDYLLVHAGGLVAIATQKDDQQLWPHILLDSCRG